MANESIIMTEKNIIMVHESIIMAKKALIIASESIIAAGRRNDRYTVSCRKIIFPKKSIFLARVRNNWFTFVH
jgi:hypothetical protein